MNKHPKITPRLSKANIQKYLFIALQYFALSLFCFGLLTTCRPAHASSQQNTLASHEPCGYAGGLSKSVSVTPQRYCGFFAPLILPASQAQRNNSASVHSYTIRLQSLYEGMTPPNKAAMPNKWGGTYRPRVNPLTLISQLRATYQNSKTVGGNHA